MEETVLARPAPAGDDRAPEMVSETKEDAPDVENIGAVSVAPVTAQEDAGDASPRLATRPRADSRGSDEVPLPMESGHVKIRLVATDAPAAPHAPPSPTAGPGTGFVRGRRASSETRASLDGFAAGDLEAATVHSVDRPATPPHTQPSYRDLVQDNLAT